MKQVSFIDEVKRVPMGIVTDFQNGKSISECIALLENCDGFKGKEKSELREWVYTANSLIRNEESAVYSETYCKMYEIITAGNENVCEKCLKKEGKRHRIDKRKAGVNFPPFHLGCKCSAIFE